MALRIMNTIHAADSLLRNSVYVMQTAHGRISVSRSRVTVETSGTSGYQAGGSNSEELDFEDEIF